MRILYEIRSAIPIRLVMTAVLGLLLFLGAISLVGTAAYAQTASSSTQGVGSSNVPAGVSAGSSSSAELMSATKQMQEMNQSFNHQYLKIQQDLQAENRQHTLDSNTNKTKHTKST